jgi:hypothetical protein
MADYSRTNQLLASAESQQGSKMMKQMLTHTHALCSKIPRQTNSQAEYHFNERYFICYFAYRYAPLAAAVRGLLIISFLILYRSQVW